jgi:hypothetical protein
MSTPPNAYTTAPLWELWLGADKAIKSARFGGIYANKSGYHNTRNAHLSEAGRERGWDDNYSVQLPLDKQGPGDKAAALDLTLSDADMKTYTKRLKQAMESGDPRMGSVKEFYGTLDGDVVYGLGKRSRSGATYKTSADSSHLWHIHLSFFRADVTDRGRVLDVLEVLTGAAKPSAPTSPSKPTTPKPSTSDWTQELIMSLPTLRRGSEGANVKRLQGLLHAAGQRDSAIDGDFGPGTERAVKDFQRAKKLSVDGIVGRNTWTRLVKG